MGGLRSPRTGSDHRQQRRRAPVRALFTALTLVSIVLGAFPAAASAAPTGSITGTVTAAVSTAEGAQVVVCDPGFSACDSTIVAADGSYTVTNLEPGPYLVRVFPAVTALLPIIDHAVDVPDGELTLDLHLLQAASLSGMATGPSGDPLPNIWVTVCEDLTTHSSCSSIATDADGTYRFDVLRPGTRGIRAEYRIAPLVRTEPAEVQLVPGPNTHDLTMPPLPTGAIEGVVRTTAGDAVEGVRVRLPVGDTVEQTTGADGRYAFPYVPQGDYPLQIQLPNANNWGRDALVTVADGPVTHDFVLGEGFVAGTVTLADGTAASDAYVTACGPLPTDSSVFTCDGDYDPDASGAYTLSYLHPGEYRFRLSIPGVVDSLWIGQRTVADGTNTIDFQLPTGGIRGTVIDPMGDPVADAHVTACSADELCFGASTDATGAFTFGYLYPSTYQLAVDAYLDGVEAHASGQAEVLDEVVEGVVLQLSDGGEPPDTRPRIRGSVLGPDGQFPSPAVTIRFCPSGTTEPESCPSRRLEDWQDEPRYSSPPLDPGDYEVTAEVDFHPWSSVHYRTVTESVTLGEDDVTLDLTLPYAGTTPISGVVLDAAGQPLPETRVFLYRADSDEQLYVTRSDADGAFAFDAVPAAGFRFELYARHPRTDASHTVGPFVAGDDPVVAEVRFPADEPGSIAGHFRYADDSPVVGAYISLCPPGRDDEAVGDTRSDVCRRRFLTDASGAFTIPSVPAGTWDVIGYDAAAARRVKAEGVVVEDVQVIQDLQHGPLPTGSLTGVVRHADGTAATGHEVYACREGECRNASTDAEGRYRIAFLDGGVYETSVEGPDLRFPPRAQVTIADEEVRLDFALSPPPTGALSGIVRTPEGGAYTQQSVTIEACHPDRFIDCAFYAQTDETGAYRIAAMPPGDYRVYLYSPHTGRRELGIASVRVGVDEVERDLTVAPAPTGSVFGRVSGADGTLADTPITACGDAGCFDGWVDSEGSYSIPMLPPDAAGYSLVVGYEGSIRARSGPVPVADEAVEHDITLPSGAIAGQVTNESREGVASSVRACDAAGACFSTYSDEQGAYRLSFLPAGAYSLTALPSSTDLFATTRDGTVAVTDGTETADLTVRGTRSVPDGMSVTTPSGTAGPGETPRFGPGSPITVRVERQDCPGAAGTLVATSQLDPSTSASAAATEVSPGVYEAILTVPFGGPVSVEMTIAGCGSVGFDVYIDPSGWVRTKSGEPIVGATVVLFHAPTPDGPWTEVIDGSIVMSPKNRTNPDLTDAEGHFGWDVLPGYYKVQASKRDCVSERTPSLRYDESPVYEIPPPVFDVDLRLRCAGAPPADTTPPAVTITSPVDEALIPQHATVLVDFSCADEIALASCVGSVPNGSALPTATLGAGQVVVTARDAAGNETVRTVSYQVVDVTPPEISVSSPSEGATFVKGALHLAAFACSDEAGGSGLDTCAGTVASGTPLDTASVGEKTFTVTARDAAGNTSVVSRSYRVVYDFRGFEAQLKAPPAFNRGTPGASLPVAFSLGSSQGADVLASALASRPVSCQTGESTGAAEPIGSVSGLAHDGASGRYRFVWKTSKAWAGSCRELLIPLADGTSPTLRVAFSR